MKAIHKLLQICSLVLFLLLNATNSAAQFNLIQKPVNPFRFGLNNLWDINIVSSTSVEIYLEARIVKNGIGPILTSTSSNIALGVGMNSLGSVNMNSKSLNYLNSDIRSWVETHQTLPPGRYSICYQIKCAMPNCGGTPIGPDNQQCFEFVLENPSPLLLNFPQDESVINITRPLLTWIPPSPVSNEVTYTLRLVKQQEKQSSQDAIQRNIPVIERSGISGNTLSFPPDVEELEKGQTYAWEVHAVLLNEKIAQSQVWEFTIGKDTIIKKQEYNNYIKIREVNPSSAIVVENILRLDYRELVAKKGSLDIEILSLSGRLKGTISTDVLYGENLLNIPIGDLGLVPNTDYLVRIKNQTGDKFELRITYSFSY